MVREIDRGRGDAVSRPGREPPPTAKRTRHGEAPAPSGRPAGLPAARPITAPGAGALAPRSLAPTGLRTAGPSSSTTAAGPSGAAPSARAPAALPMCAEIAWRLLSARARGDSTRECAEALNIPRSTANKWLAPGRWQAENLANRLSNMPDYAAYKSRLEPLVASFGLHAGPLPEPPERSRAKMDALVLKSALEAIVAHRERTGGRGRGLSQPALTELLRQQGLQVSMWTLADWLTADGRLKTAPSSIANLPGFAQESEAIAQALSALGHGDLATELASAAPGALQAVHARDIATALQALAAAPEQGLPKVCLDLGLPTSIAKYFSSAGRPRATIETVAALPDFAEHRAEILAALDRLGHAADAASLPGASMPLRDAHDQLGRHFDGVVQAAAAMRSQPPRPLLDAARAFGVPPQLLAVLVGPDGHMQARATIDGRVTGDHALIRSAMAGLLDRLATALAAGPSQPPAAAATLKAMFIEGAGRAPDRTLVVHQNSLDVGANVAGRLRQIFQPDPLAVRMPRSYADERPRQALRWLASVLLQQFPLGVEFQCYFHRGTRQIVLSSNSDAVNDEMRAFLQGGGLEALLAGGAGAAEPATRAQRHQARLSHAMGDLAPAADAELDDVLAAIAERRFQVPARRYTDRQRTLDLHAERRVKEFVQMLDPDFDARRLAGTKRPCGTCADVVGLPADGTRGPFWHSKNAQAGTDTESIIARNVAQGIRTSITRTRTGRLTFDTNTDSDSDA